MLRCRPPAPLQTEGEAGVRAPGEHGAVRPADALEKGKGKVRRLD